MAQSRIQPGAVIDGFTVGECVHNGGMATLWSVSHPGIAAPLLMKIPRVSEGEDPAAIVSFEMEQMILPRLSGPHVPACFATGDFARQAYVVIERIPGQTLYKRLADLPLAYEEARAVAAKIASALADLHRQNVIHHDIKPSSIMFRPSGEAVLIDFGLSHHNHLPDLLQEEFRLPFGTAPYTAPERLLGARDDPRSDLFSLGVLLYFFTTGVRPFGETETLRGTTARILATLPSARLACVNVLKLGRITIDRTLDKEGHNKHVERLVALKHWASPLKLDEDRLSIHVLEAVDAASTILEFTRANHVDHIIIGAQQHSGLSALLGGVSGKVASEAVCTVTVVRPPRLAAQSEKLDGEERSTASL